MLDDRELGCAVGRGDGALSRGAVACLWFGGLVKRCSGGVWRPQHKTQPPPRRDVGRSLQPPVLFEGVQRATHPNKDGMGGQGVGTRTEEVQDSRGEGGAGKGHSHREAASAFGGKHQSLTPSLVKGPSSAGAPLTSQGGQGWANPKEGTARRKWPLSVVSPGCL